MKEADADPIQDALDLEISSPEYQCAEGAFTAEFAKSCIAKSRLTFAEQLHDLAASSLMTSLTEDAGLLLAGP